MMSGRRRKQGVEKSEAELATSGTARGRGGPSKFYRSDAWRRRQLAGHRAQTFLSEEVEENTRQKEQKDFNNLYLI